MDELIPSRGAKAEHFTMEVGRPLTHSDIIRIGDGPKVGVPVLQKIRATHHRQALLLAQGKGIREVAAIVGCTPQRLTQLQTDPSFIELVGYYQDQTMRNLLEETTRVKAKLVEVGEMAIDEIHERLQDETALKKMSVDTLRRLGEFTMDRTIAPPQAAPNATIAPTSVTINFGTPIKTPAELAGEHETTIEGKAEPETKPQL